MKTRSVYFSFFIIIGFMNLSAQTLKPTDFIVGPLFINESMDSLLSIIGKPLRIEDIDGDKEYSYKNFTIWFNDKNKVSAYQIMDSTFTLPRELKIGDSMQRVIKLFGKDFEANTLFERIGSYDYKFKDYSKYLLYQYDTGIVDKDCNTLDNYYWMIAFYFKNNSLIRILFYEGICE